MNIIKCVTDKLLSLVPQLHNIYEQYDHESQYDLIEMEEYGVKGSDNYVYSVNILEIEPRNEICMIPIQFFELDTMIYYCKVETVKSTFYSDSIDHKTLNLMYYNVKYNKIIAMIIRYMLKILYWTHTRILLLNQISSYYKLYLAIKIIKCVKAIKIS